MREGHKYTSHANSMMFILFVCKYNKLYCKYILDVCTSQQGLHTRAGSTTNLTALVLFVYVFKVGQLCKHIYSKQPLAIKIKSLFFPTIKAHNMHLKVCFIVGMWTNYCLFTFSNSVNSVNIQTLNSPPPSK